MENKDFEIFLKKVKTGDMPVTVGFSFYEHQIGLLKEAVIENGSDTMLKYFEYCIANRSKGIRAYTPR